MPADKKSLKKSKTFTDGIDKKYESELEEFRRAKQIKNLEKEMRLEFVIRNAK